MIRRLSKRLSNQKNANDLNQLIANQKWKAARKFLRNQTSSSTVEDSILHKAIHADAPLKVICEIIIQQPDALFYANELGQLPLHVAAYCGLKQDVIEALSRSYPQAAMEVDEDGRTPFHLACLQGHVNERILETYLEFHPSVLSTEDYNEETPLECYISGDNKAEASVMSMLQDFTGHSNKIIKHYESCSDDSSMAATDRMSLSSFTDARY